MTTWDDDNLPTLKATEINRAREGVYGDPADNMEVFAALISPVLEITVSPMQAAMILVQLKVMREVQANYPLDYLDNLEDMCGFTNVLYKTKEAERDRLDSAKPASEGAGGVGGAQLPRSTHARKSTRRSGGAR